MMGRSLNLDPVFGPFLYRLPCYCGDHKNGPQFSQLHAWQCEFNRKYTRHYSSETLLLS